MYRSIATTLLTLGMVATVTAEPVDYSLDMGHSRIFFDVNHQGYSIMRGMFHNFGGTFSFDAEDPTASSLDITIDATSLDMFNEPLNDHLRRDDFFGVETHPELHFASTEIEETGENQFTLHGNLTILGQTHPVALDVTQNQLGKTRNGADKAGFSASGTIDRTAYGMSFGVPVIGADVAVTIQIEATHGGGAPTGGMGMGMGMGQ